MSAAEECDAVFRDGAFRPLDPGGLRAREGERVHLRIEHVEADSPSGDPVELLSSVFDGLTSEEVERISRNALDRSRFLEGRPGWDA
ncbi:MAG: antitoxin family protein [Planctomycetota bacterium]